MIQKILRLFGNTLSADEKHYLLKRDNLAKLNQMQLSQKQKSFPEFFFFCIFKIYIKSYSFAKKKETQIADVFPEKLLARNMAR